MRWNFVFVVLFIAFATLSIVFATRKLVAYNRTSVEQVSEPLKEGDESAGTISHPENVLRTYQENYAAAGGAVASGLIAAAALLAFAFTLKESKTTAMQS